jgi:RNA polymerase sigma-70 factor (ECF subfamily)
MSSSPDSPSSPRSPGSSTSSEALALEAQRGSRDAFGALVERHEASLLRFLRTRVATGAEAEELVQEAFLRAWRKLATYDARLRFSTWLFTVARNLAVSHGRVRRLAAVAMEDCSMLADASEAASAGPERALHERESAERIWSLADLVLTRDQREALWLRYAEDLTADEIGVVLGRRAVAVRVLLFRARATLARHLEPLERPARERELPSSIPRERGVDSASARKLAAREALS